MHSRLRRSLVAASVVLVGIGLASTSAFAQQAPDQQDRVQQDQPQPAVDGIRLHLKRADLFSVSPVAAPKASAALLGSHHEGIGIGVKGGLVFASFSDAQNTSFKNNNGWLFGLFLGGNRPGLVGVMAEIDYAKKGAKDDAGHALSLYYIEVPVLIRINFGASSLNGVSGYVIGGPAFAIQLKGSLDGIDVKSQYQTLDVNYIIGGGVEITRFIIEARVDNGFRNVNKGNLASTTAIHNRAFELLFGIRFN